MSEAQEHPFKEGTVVAVYNAGRWGLPNPRKTVVEKLRKDGRFLIKGSDRQWKATKSTWDYKWQAYEAGGDRWGSASICPNRKLKPLRP